MQIDQDNVCMVDVHPTLCLDFKTLVLSWDKRMWIFVGEMDFDYVGPSVVIGCHEYMP